MKREPLAAASMRKVRDLRNILTNIDIYYSLLDCVNFRQHESHEFAQSSLINASNQGVTGGL